MNTFIRLLYAILIAAAIVAFVAVGIYTFYPAPKAPDYPTVSEPVQKGGLPPTEPLSQVNYDKAYKQYQADSQTYNRNVSIIVTAIAAVIVVGGLFYIRKYSDIIGEGVALGGIGNSIYGIVTAGMADDRIMRFVAVTVFLASAILVVYVQFNDKASVQKPTRKK